MYYDTLTCDVLVGGNTSSICRLNIETGRFNSSIETSYSSINKLELNPLHRLLAVGSGSSPLVSYVDMRTRKTVGSLNMSAFSLIENDAVEVSSLKFLPNGLSLAVGTSNGIVLLFDLRSNKPYAQRDHSYGLPIKTITYHEQERYILSADSKIVKIWRPTEDSIADGDEESPLLASVEPPHTINDLCLQQGTGFFMLANEGSQIQSFYIPSLGPAPKWCAFLDNLTEELEENPQPVVYDNYKFVTRADLATLGIEHLIGTSTLRAYMHGFFMDFRLYEKAKSIQNPFAFEEYRERQLMEKIELQRASRIHASALKKLPKVNRALAEKLLKKTGLDLTQRDKSSNDLLDTRFKEIFEDEDFMVDETSREYAMLHPTEAAAKGSEAVNSIHVKSQHEDDVEEDEEDDDVVDPKVAVAFPPNRPRHLTHKPKGSRSASGGGSSTSRGGSRYTSAKNSTDRSHRGSARGPSKGTSRGTSKGANRR